jgi:hypothetical protein
MVLRKCLEGDVMSCVINGGWPSSSEWFQVEPNLFGRRENLKSAF